MHYTAQGGADWEEGHGIGSSRQAGTLAPRAPTGPPPGACPALPLPPERPPSPCMPHFHHVRMNAPRLHRRQSRRCWVRRRSSLPPPPSFGDLVGRRSRKPLAWGPEAEGGGPRLRRPSYSAPLTQRGAYCIKTSEGIARMRQRSDIPCGMHGSTQNNILRPEIP